MDTIAYPSPESINSRSHLRLLHDEDDAPYDGQSKAERRGTAHMTTVRDDVLDELVARLGLPALGLYTYLERRANKQGQCALSYSRIADDTKSSRRHIIDLVKVLADDGYVRVTTPPDTQRTHTPNTFTLPFHPRQRLVQDMHQPSERASERASAESAPKVISKYSLSKTPPLPPTGQNGHAAAASRDEYITLLGETTTTKLASWLVELDRNFGGVGWVKNTLRKLHDDVPGLDRAQLKSGMELGFDRLETELEADRRKEQPTIRSPRAIAIAYFREALQEQQS